MKNTKSLNLFIQREILQCILTKTSQQEEEGGQSHLEPNDISNHILQQLINHNLSGLMQNEKLSIDYTLLYQCFDILEILGLISRKSDAHCNQRFLIWQGFKRMKTKFGPIFKGDFKS